MQLIAYYMKTLLKPVQCVIRTVVHMQNYPYIYCINIYDFSYKQEHLKGESKVHIILHYTDSASNLKNDTTTQYLTK